MELKTKAHELKSFGYLMGIMLILVFAIILPYVFDHILGAATVLFGVYSTPIWPWLAACCFWLTALIWPILLQPIYFVWMKIGLVVGWVNTRLILLLMFYAMMLPMGLIMRILGKNAIRIKARQASYRITSKQSDKTQLERPY